MDGYHINVLFTRTEKQEEYLNLIKAALPKERGRVFMPMREHYRRDRKSIELKPLFPGYIFLETDMDRTEVHNMLKPIKNRLMTFMKELGFDKDDDNEDERLSDLTHDEEQFFSLILDDEGIERMSYGYRETGTYEIKVLEGPLQNFADCIEKCDKHERVAWLKLRFREYEIMAGLTLKPKRIYFPDDEDAPILLSDGTEVDLKELKKRIMGA